MQELLQFITDTHSQENSEQVAGTDFGSGVASRAQLIGRPDGPSADAAGQGEEEGDEDPGNSENAPGRDPEGPPGVTGAG